MAEVCCKLPVPDHFSMEDRLYRPHPLDDAAARLEALRALARADIDVLRYPSQPLPYTSRAGMLEVAVVGGGQNGRCIAFGLRRHGCHNVKVYDRNPKGRQGPWRSYGRNHLLRTNKEHVGGLDWGFPNLHFQRWSDAKFGADYYGQIKKIPRALWADYLDWYAETLALPIEYETDVQEIDWDDEKKCFRLGTSRGVECAQYVVICSGIESAGSHRFPPFVTDALPRTAYAHTMEAIAGQSLTGRDVVVIGGGASAFDTANMALDAGAARVDMMIRRPSLPAVHRMCWGSKWNGYHRHYIELPDDLRWSYSLADMELGVPPPRDTYYEAVRDDRFTLYGSAGIDEIRYERGRIVGSYGGAIMEHDFMICGTGSRNRISDQRELASLLPDVQLWKDAFVDHGQRSHPELENSPYLGPALQLTPKSPDAAHVSRVYYLCSGVAHLSGFRCNLSGLQFAAPRICHDISKNLFLAHARDVKQAFDDYALWE